MAKSLLCLGLAALSVVAGWTAGAVAAPSEISNVYPDYPGFGPHIITGEGFDAAGVEVWTWEPSAPEGMEKEAASQLGSAMPELPAQPPEGARRIKTLDVERQVIVASLTGTVLWVKTAEGVSKPHLFNVAKPLWISESKAAPGALVYIFGFGLRAPYRHTTVAIRSDTATLFPRVIVEARALRTADSRLVYFEIPKEATPDRYSVYLHNSYGGRWGWRKAGDLKVTPSGLERTKTFNVGDYGAKGDGLTNDYQAIRSAVDAAHQVGGGVVLFPPGVYATNRTILVPSGVRLRGASREAAILQGVGDAATASRIAWFQRVSPPTSVVRLHSHTGLETLTVRGATFQGEGGYGLVEAIPDEIVFPIGGEVQEVTIGDCCLRAAEEDALSRRPLYLSAFHAGPAARRIKLLNNEIYGAANWGIGGIGPAVRTEIIGNTFHGGAVNDVVTINGAFSQSLIDSNRLVDTPGRIVLGMGRHNYLRFNEIHQAFRGTWENAEEIYLVHGGVEANKTVGLATGAAPMTLVDTRQHWKSGLHRDDTVLIISGRGFGQYRRVTDNTADTLTVQPAWNVTPDATSEYVVAPQFVENAFFANLNNTPCRLSLWLDCIANLVEMHRDDHAKGADLWGEDGSVVDEEGVGHGLSKFFPAYYNCFVNNWMDGTALWLGTPGAKGNNAHVGYPSFGNFVVRSRIREPHAYRTGFDVNPRADAGINVGGGSGRAGTSHTIVADNFLASTYTGISVADTARKTFLLHNEFDHVDNPIADRGARTVSQGNRVAGRSDSSGKLTDGRSDRDLPAWQPRAWTADTAEELPPLFHDVLALKTLVSQPVYCLYTEVDSPERQARCQEHLRQLFTLLKEYESKQGCLPKAAFFPTRAASSEDSLSVLLGPQAATLLICPTCSPELQCLGLNYAWNEKVGGRKLADLKADTWLLIDFVAAHDWMTVNHYSGHRGGVNVLYADGTVKWIPPFSTEQWNKASGGRWGDWARE